MFTANFEYLYPEAAHAFACRRQDSDVYDKRQGHWGEDHWGSGGSALRSAAILGERQTQITTKYAYPASAWWVCSKFVVVGLDGSCYLLMCFEGGLCRFQACADLPF